MCIVSNWHLWVDCIVILLAHKRKQVDLLFAYLLLCLGKYFYLKENVSTPTRELQESSPGLRLTRVQFLVDLDLDLGLNTGGKPIKVNE